MNIKIFRTIPFAILIICSGISFVNCTNTNETKKLTNNTQLHEPSISNPLSSNKGDQQTLFNIHKTISYSIKKYQEAKNEIQKSDSYREMLNEIKSIMVPYNREFENWEGVIRTIQTLGKGGDKLQIMIETEYGGSTIHFKSYCTILDCGIDINSPVYNMVRPLNEGDKVAFSGKFLEDKSGVLLESSFTEIGAIRLPEFNIEFTQIKKSERLPDKFQVKINEMPKGFRLPTKSDVTGDWKAFINKVPFPYICSGDFNDDKIIDTAKVLLQTDNSGWGIFIFLYNSSNAVTVYKIKEYSMNVPPQHIYISPTENGIYQTACGKGYRDCDPNEPQTIELKAPAIYFSPYESGGAFIIYWSKTLNKFISVSMTE